mmetsp:Transcript_4705/g.11069  ORF Transcript_4705/g.11069 Transcript_4705/m.11069 type:complete len:93 (-) Transcript_4705:431-709(-)
MIFKVAFSETLRKRDPEGRGLQEFFVDLIGNSYPNKREGKRCHKGPVDNPLSIESWHSKGPRVQHMWQCDLQAKPADGRSDPKCSHASYRIL